MKTKELTRMINRRAKATSKSPNEILVEAINRLPLIGCRQPFKCKVAVNPEQKN